MKSVPQRILRFALALAVIGSLLPSASAQAVFAAWRNHVWKIDSTGGAGEVQWNFGAEMGETDDRGTTYPVVSPDSKHIAFTRKNDLWLLDTEKMQEQQITMVGKPQTKRYAAVKVFITVWSPDSSALIYRVEAGVTGEDESMGPALIPRKAGYGPFGCDVETGKTSPTGYPGKLLAWLPEPAGDYLVERGGEADGAKRLVRFFPGKPDGAALLGEGRSLEQVQLSPDGKRVLGMLEVKPGERMAVVELDLETKKLNQLAEGGWADIQWPQYSPSGKHISYLKRHPAKEQGTYGNDLIVDGKPVFSADRMFDLHWIDDNTAGLLFYDYTEKHNHTWKIIDWPSKREKHAPAAR